MLRLSLLFLLAATGASAQSPPSVTEGRSLLSRQIPWQETGGNAQNWAMAQHPGGLIYVANTEGILEHDGSTWRLHELPLAERLLVHALAMGPGGRMYAGGIGDVGYLVSDQDGTLGYRSLKSHIAPGDRGFTDVWAAYSTREGVVFQSEQRLFRWNGRRMEAWASETRFHAAFLVRGVVYVREDGVGLQALGARGLRPVPGGDAFADRKVDALLPHGQGGLLAVVRDEGLVAISARGQVRPVPGEASAYFVAHRPYVAVAVPDLYRPGGVLYAVGTFGGGVAFVAPDGSLVRVYREDVGLTLGDDVLGLSPDGQGGLWVALQNGVARIDLFARHTWFDETDGIVGSPNTVAEAEGTVFVGTDAYLFRQVAGRLGRDGAAGPAYTRFEQIQGVPSTRGAVGDVLGTEAGVLVGAHDGIYTVERGAVRKVSSGRAAYALVAVGRARVYVGTKEGLERLALRGGRWVLDGTIDGITGETRFVQLDAEGALWVSQPGGALSRIPDPGAARPRVQTFGPADGMSVPPGPLSLATDGHLLMSTRDGVYRVQRVGARVRLISDPAFVRLGGAYSLFPTSGQTWVYASGRLSDRRPGGFRMAGLQPNEVIVQASGVAYVATPDGLLRYDPRVPLGRRTYPMFLRRVTDRKRNVLYGGAYGWRERDGVDLVVPIKRAVGGLRFEYASALFDRPGRVEYQSRMLGTDNETWGPWAPEAVAPYVGIREGTYTFEVRARNDIGQHSETVSFRVRVLPPWYRSWWAYTLYVVALLTLIWAYVAWRLRKQRLRIEAMQARNARMQRLGARLRETNLRLRLADTLKDDLLANTSHELRTPLTAVLGFSEMLLDEVTGDARDLAEGIHRGGQRLLATVDGMLDLFKLQSGTVDLFPQDVDAAAVVRESVRALGGLAAARGLTLRVMPDGLALPAQIDRGVLDRMLLHVVGNAVKFTEAGGVTVLVDATDDEVQVSVTDTGVGIPAEMVGRVFEPFVQASAGFARSHEGTGLGLAIVRRLADLVGGTVTVESVEGLGTTVRIAVPRWADLAAPARRVAEVAENPALGGAHLLAVGLGLSVGTLREWVAPRGTVGAAESLGGAVREARRTAYDAVFVAAATEAAERKRVAVVRGVPGYTALPVLRVGGDALGAAELAARGFTHQVALPLQPDAVLTLLEALLMTVEDAVDE